MPLRDHFRAPLDEVTSWEGFHGQWPAMLVQWLNDRLPPDFVAEPRVHLGAAFEVDVAAYDSGVPESVGAPGPAESLETAWSPAQPTVLLETSLAEPSGYEVLVYDLRRGRRLVAAVEIVSPANKDRPEHRRAFVRKCVALLRQEVSVTIIDLVTSRGGNLFAELAEDLGAAEPATADALLYAVTCRGRQRAGKWRVESWEHPLRIGNPLPTLPLWLSPDQAVPLDLETSYEATCRALRIP